MGNERILPALSEKLRARTQWDEPPAVYLTYDRGGEVVFSKLSLPDGFWDGKDPVEVLEVVGKMMMQYQGKGVGLPHELLGLSFRFEGWGIPPHNPQELDPETRERYELDPETRERYETALHEHRVHELPERREARHMMTVDLDGSFYWAMQERGEDVKTVDMAGEEPHGRLPDALVRLVFGIKAVASG